MDETKFPWGLSRELSGRSFKELLETNPKLVEFVDSSWNKKNTTGLFLKFYKYIKAMLNDPLTKSEHHVRCFELVKNIDSEELLPSYLNKFKIKETEPIDVD